MNPVFADYMQAYGEGGLKALRLGHLPELARIYWYTVEVGLIATQEGLRIYGSGGPPGGFNIRHGQMPSGYPHGTTNPR